MKPSSVIGMSLCALICPPVGLGVFGLYLDKKNSPNTNSVSNCLFGTALGVMVNIGIATHQYGTQYGVVQYDSQTDRLYQDVEWRNQRWVGFAFPLVEELINPTKEGVRYQEKPPERPPIIEDEPLDWYNVI